MTFFFFGLVGSSKVCGLKWSYDNRELASGGNDNRVRTCKLRHLSELPHCTVTPLLLMQWLTNNFLCMFAVACLESTLNPAHPEVL